MVRGRLKSQGTAALAVSWRVTICAIPTEGPEGIGSTDGSRRFDDFEAILGRPDTVRVSPIEASCRVLPFVVVEHRIFASWERNISLPPIGHVGNSFHRIQPLLDDHKGTNVRLTEVSGALGCGPLGFEVVQAGCFTRSGGGREVADVGGATGRDDHRGDQRQKRVSCAMHARSVCLAVRVCKDGSRAILHSGRM